MAIKFSQFVGQPLTEAKDLFNDVDVIRLDPDRADATDVVSALMPTIVRIAYTNLIHERNKYERTHTDEEDDKFEFTVEALDEKVEELVDHIRDRLDMSRHDRESYINRLKDEFKEKLE